MKLMLCSYVCVKFDSVNSQPNRLEWRFQNTNPIRFQLFLLLLFIPIVLLWHLQSSILFVRSKNIRREWVTLWLYHFYRAIQIEHKNISWMLNCEQTKELRDERAEITKKKGGNHDDDDDEGICRSSHPTTHANVVIPAFNAQRIRTSVRCLNHPKKIVTFKYHVMSMTNNVTNEKKWHNIFFAPSLPSSVISVLWLLIIKKKRQRKFHIYLDHYLHATNSYTPHSPHSIASCKFVYLLADEILQHRWFARTLSTDHSNLWQIQLHVHAQLCECILQLIHNRNERFHSLITRHFGVSRIFLHNYSKSWMKNQVGGGKTHAAAQLFTHYYFWGRHLSNTPKNNSFFSSSVFLFHYWIRSSF